MPLCACASLLCVVAQLFLLLNSEQQGSVGAKDGTRVGPQAANAKLNALKSQVSPRAIACARSRDICTGSGWVSKLLDMRVPQAHMVMHGAGRAACLTIT